MSNHQVSDEELVLLARQGNQEALDKLKNKYEMLSWKFAKDFYMQHKTSGITIDEYHSVVFERFFFCFRNFENDGNYFFQYWRTSANNELVHYFKANAYEAGASSFNGVYYDQNGEDALNAIDVLGEPDYYIKHSLFIEEYANEMVKLMNELKDSKDKLIINLFLDGYSPKEIAKETSYSSRHVYYVVKTFQEKMLNFLRKLKN